jgi:hypothetical protein
MFISVVRAPLFLVFAMRFVLCVLSLSTVCLACKHEPSIFGMPLSCIVLPRLCACALVAVFGFGLLSTCTAPWHLVCRTQIHPSQAIDIGVWLCIAPAIPNTSPTVFSIAASRIVGSLALEGCVLTTHLPFNAALMLAVLCATTVSECRREASFF